MDQFINELVSRQQLWACSIVMQFWAFWSKKWIHNYLVFQLNEGREVLTHQDKLDYIGKIY